MPYESQYDYMRQLANSFKLYRDGDASFDADAFDADFQESIAWGQATYNPDNRPAPIWHDLARSKAEKSYWERLCMFGPF